MENEYLVGVWAALFPLTLTWLRWRATWRRPRRLSRLIAGACCLAIVHGMVEQIFCETEDELFASLGRVVMCAWYSAAMLVIEMVLSRPLRRGPPGYA